MSWTHAQCKTCWDKEHLAEGEEWKGETEQEPFSVVDKEVEICCTCGARTASGIYIRRDPKEVLYTKEDK